MNKEKNEIMLDFLKEIQHLQLKYSRLINIWIHTYSKSGDLDAINVTVIGEDIYQNKIHKDFDFYDFNTSEFDYKLTDLKKILVEIQNDYLKYIGL